MTLPVVLGALAFIFIAVLALALCKAAAQGDRQFDELESRRRARRAESNGIRDVGRAS